VVENNFEDKILPSHLIKALQLVMHGNISYVPIFLSVCCI